MKMGTKYMLQTQGHMSKSQNQSQMPCYWKSLFYNGNASDKNNINTA